MAASEVRHHAEAHAAQARGDRHVAAKHTTLAESARAAADFYHARGDLDEQLQAARQKWVARTAHIRLAAVQADAFLRRRHPHMALEPLRSAEPEPLPDQLPQINPDANQRHAFLVADRLAVVQSRPNQ